MGRDRGRDDLVLKKTKAKRKRDMWVYTEGGLTEPQYIDIIKTLQDTNDVHIVNDTRQAGGKKGGKDGRVDHEPLDLVEAAIKLKREKDRQARRARISNELMPVVWCIFDQDEHEHVDTAIARAAKAGVKVAFSHPCFELWRLLHHQDFTRTCGGVCDDVAGRLPFAKDMSKKERKVVSLDQIEGGYQVAKQRAQRLNARHDDHVPFSRRDPCTDVWRFVEDLGITEY